MGSKSRGHREKSVMPPEQDGSQRTEREDKSAVSPPDRGDTAKMDHGKAWRVRVLQHPAAYSEYVTFYPMVTTG